MSASTLAAPPWQVRFAVPPTPPLRLPPRRKPADGANSISRNTSIGDAGYDTSTKSMHGNEFVAAPVCAIGKLRARARHCGLPMKSKRAKQRPAQPAKNGRA
jgi:hypothetical protein